MANVKKEIQMIESNFVFNHLYVGIVGGAAVCCCWILMIIFLLLISRFFNWFLKPREWSTCFDLFFFCFLLSFLWLFDCLVTYSGILNLKYNFLPIWLYFLLLYPTLNFFHSKLWAFSSLLTKWSPFFEKKSDHQLRHTKTATIWKIYSKPFFRFKFQAN